MKGRIYKITNNINNKVYIGKTYDSIESRFKEHARESRKDRCKNRPLYRAFNKHGIENFFIELIEEYEEGLLEEMEIKFIMKYNSYKNGYNATLGGDGKRYFPYSDEEVIKKYQELKYVNKTADYFKCGVDIIRKILNNNKITINKQAGPKKRSKKVVKLSKDTSEIIEIYSSIIEAARNLGNKNKRRHISEVCDGKRKSAYGYK